MTNQIVFSEDCLPQRERDMSALIFGSEAANNMLKNTKRLIFEERAELIAAHDEGKSIEETKFEIDCLEDEVSEAQSDLNFARERLHEAQRKQKLMVDFRDSGKVLPEPEMVIPDCQLQWKTEGAI